MAARSELSHQMRFRSRVLRYMLVNVNERRDWRVYADSVQSLIRRVVPLPMANRALFSLDQAASAHPLFHGHFGQSGAHPELVRH